MPEKKKSSVTTKLFGFAIVIAVIVFGAKSQIPINDQLTNQQIQRTQVQNIAVPVDRSLLSQRLLPALSGFNSMDEMENTFYTNMPRNSEVGAESSQESSPKGPSLYKLKLDDQKAWGSQPRRASLVSRTSQPVGPSEKVSVASSQSPIVPGHEDPHSWYESQFLELAVSLDDQNKEQLTTKDSIEFKPLPDLSPENSLSAILPPKALPAKTVPVAETPEKAPAPKAVPAPAAGMTRSWETGRY